ncbi:hypothetical protein EBT16_05720 [bacterium]|nr:hypothetical protein [bacterium]
MSPKPYDARIEVAKRLPRKSGVGVCAQKRCIQSVSGILKRSFKLCEARQSGKDLSPRDFFYLESQEFRPNPCLCF